MRFSAANSDIIRVCGISFVRTEFQVTGAFRSAIMKGDNCKAIVAAALNDCEKEKI